MREDLEDDLEIFNFPEAIHFLSRIDTHNAFHIPQTRKWFEKLLHSFIHSEKKRKNNGNCGRCKRRN